MKIGKFLLTASERLGINLSSKHDSKKKALKSLLKKLSKKSKKLKKDLKDEKNKKKQKEIEEDLEIISVQRKKGIEIFKKIKKE